LKKYVHFANLTDLSITHQKIIKLNFGCFAVN